jgi:hypothetical protein
MGTSYFAGGTLRVEAVAVAKPSLEFMVIGAAQRKQNHPLTS